MATTKKISEYSALTSPAASDLLEIVDVSDTSAAPTGTNKKIAVSDLVSGGVVPDDSVTNAKLANMAQATIKGRASGAGTGDPTDLTGTQATEILDNVVGDSGSGGTKGLVPAPGAGDAAAGKFLKADGTFAVPAGTGAETGANSDITSMDGLTGAIQAPTQINDSNGNEVLKFGSTASAVNEVTITNKATGNAPTIAATGGDTDIDLSLSGKGAGKVKATDLEVTESLRLSGDISPAQLTANTDDWNPTNLADASTIRFSTDASRNITGLQGGADGRLLVLHNIGSNNAVLKDESASSSAANRFALNADVTLGADQSALLQYDSTSSRWRLVAGPSAGGGGGVPSSSTNIIPYSDGSAFQNSPVSREDANTLGHWNGTGETATRHNWYTNRADASNYDRLSVRYDTSNDNWVLESDKAGTGSLRRLHFAVGGTSYWRIETTGHFRAHDSTSQMSLNTGSASAPGLQFGGSSGSNTGIYGPAVNTIGITISTGYTIRFFDLGIQVGHQKGYYISSTALGSGTTSTVGFERENTNIARIVTTESNTGGASYGDLKLRTLIGEPASPAQLTADQNNYNPGRQRFQRWSSDASRTVTGLSNSQVDGQEHLIVNVGSNNIVLSHQNASSSAGNRFLNSTGADITLAANEAADIIYDNTTGRWRVFKR